MGIYAKYTFHPDQLPDLSKVAGKYVVLGHLVKELAVYDENENLITPTIRSEKIAVDILWNDNAALQFKDNRVFPDHHRHWVFGMENYFEQD